MHAVTERCEAICPTVAEASATIPNLMITLAGTDASRDFCHEDDHASSGLKMIVQVGSSAGHRERNFFSAEAERCRVRCITTHVWTKMTNTASWNRRTDRSMLPLCFKPLRLLQLILSDRG